MALRYTNSVTGPNVYPGSTSIAVLRLQHRLNNLQCPICLAEATNNNAQNTDQWVNLHTGSHPHTVCLKCRRHMNRMKIKYGKGHCPLCKEQIKQAYNPDLRGVTFVPGVDIRMGPLDKPHGRSRAWWWYEPEEEEEEYAGIPWWPLVEVKLNPRGPRAPDDRSEALAGILEVHVVTINFENHAIHTHTRKYSLKHKFKITRDLLTAKVRVRFDDSDHATVFFIRKGKFKKFTLHMSDNGGFPFDERYIL